MPANPNPVGWLEQPLSASSPVRSIPSDPAARELRDATALCMSGGGYRAMLFHLGALWRLNELGLLGKLDRISSVSGGSITAGVLALHWNDLGVTPDAPARRFHVVVDEVRKLASHTIDIGPVLEGVFGPGSVSDRVQDAYDRILFHGATLQDLPDDAPRFVFNATNVQSCVLFRFSKPFLADWRVGVVKSPRVPLSLAVAASSAFPPVLSPCELDFQRFGCVFEPASGADLQRDPYTSKAILSDGGVYDNLGLETVWKSYRTVLVSDGGGHVSPEEKPHRDWARHAYRALDIIDSQVRALRVRQTIDAFIRAERLGVYWGIRSEIEGKKTPGLLPCPVEQTMPLALTPTRLKAMPDGLQEALIDWGYASADASIRTYWNPALPAAAGFPYPRGLVAE
jgi:NTE family protein